MTLAGPLIGAGRQAEVFAWGEGRVLKLYRRAEAERDAYAEAEYTRLAYAAGAAARSAVGEAHSRVSLARFAGAPAPAVYETVLVEGRPGVVYERLSGPTMLSVLVAQPWRVTALARQMAEVHAQLHRCPGVGLPSQSRRVTELAGWIETRSDFTPALRATLVRVVNALPEGDRLCHGDLHPDNVLLTERGPRVIDWMNAWCGHPLADVARTSIMLRLGDPPPGFVQRAIIALFRSLFHALYLRHYFRAQTDYAPNELRAWELPLAVARLTDGITAERTVLLKFIEERAKEVKADGVLSRQSSSQI
ncbi:MAG: phosphotransferase family protein [Anaerolineales bacterium]